MDTSLTTFRAAGCSKAIVFIHGINSDPLRWSDFAAALEPHHELRDWDVFSFDYAALSKIGWFSGGASLPVIAEHLHRALSEQLKDYAQLALIAHNAGGLIAQLALLAHEDLRPRVSHVFFFAPVNAGFRLPMPEAFDSFLPLMAWFSPVYAQLEEMRPASALLARINDAWRAQFAEESPLQQWWIGGNQDRLAPLEALTNANSSRRFIIAGDHASIIQPETAEKPAVGLVVRGLLNEAPPEASRRAAAGLDILQQKVEQQIYDVFLHGVAADRVEMGQLAARLSQSGIRVWLLEDHVLAGRKVHAAYDRDRTSMRALAVCIGGSRRPAWNQDALVTDFDARGYPVIPVFLRAAPREADLTPPLADFGAVDFRSADDDAFDALVAGITGRKPVRRMTRATPNEVRKPNWRRRLAIGAPLAVLILAAGFQAYEYWLSSTTVPGAQSSANNRAHYVRHNQGASRVLVFVHGILGNAGDTWTRPPNIYWPELVASDPSFDGTNIYVDHYESGVGNRMTMDELANSMNDRLMANGVLEHAQIVFVAHSMGGLITQRFLSLYREYGEKVPAVFLYGTPQNGAQIARLLSKFSNDPALRQLGDPNSYLKAIENDWRSAQQQWRKQNLSIARFCAYEKLPYNGVVIVDEASGTNLCDDLPVAINAHHANIVKPASLEDASYIFLKNRWRGLTRVEQANP